MGQPAEIIIIVGGGQPPGGGRLAETEEGEIKVKVWKPDNVSVADALRAALAKVEGTPQE